MSFDIDASLGDGMASIVFRGEFSRSTIEQKICELNDQIMSGVAYHVDMSQCALAMTASEFMSVVDFWFETLGSATQMALVFDPITQKDQAMLFDTKSFLIGGRQKTFADDIAAKKWLRGWPKAAT